LVVFLFRGFRPFIGSDATPNSFNAPPEISIEAPNLDVDASTTIIARDNVDLDVEGLQLAREELFGYLELLRNNPPATLSKTKQLIGLVKKCWMMPTIFTLWIMTSPLGWVLLSHI
jgi:hypothetical protein